LVSPPVATWTRVPDANIAGHLSDIVAVLRRPDVASACVITDGRDLCVTGHNRVRQLGLRHFNHVSLWTKMEITELAGNTRSVSGGYHSASFVVTHSRGLFVAPRTLKGNSASETPTTAAHGRRPKRKG
jgi:hypothetical protein